MKRKRKGAAARDSAAAPAGPPKEIPFTDLNIDETAEARPSAKARTGGGDHHAAGTPGGGTAFGGLAGANYGDGTPEEDELEEAMGSGLHDNGDDDEEAPAYGGPAAGAVGGTPAEHRAKGGRFHRETNLPHDSRGDSTIGSKDWDRPRSASS